MTQLAYSSVPTWARPTTPESPAPANRELSDLTGTSYVLVGAGTDDADVIRAWVSSLPADVDRTVLIDTDIDAVIAQLRDILQNSMVGVRVAITGTTGDCLRLRAEAVNAGLNDDEITVVPSGTGAIDVFCSHCRTVTQTDAAVDDIIECAGCSRSLLVYYHVSRRMGAYLGFMVDAETTPTGAPS